MGARTASWNAEEDALLRDLYPRAPWADLEAKIGRSRSAVHHRAFALGIKREQRDFKPGVLEALSKRMRTKPLRLGKVIYPIIAREGVEGKICGGQCASWKPLQKFAKSKDCSGGRKNICTTCAGRQAYAKNPERSKATVRAYQASHPEARRLHKQAADWKRHGRIMAGPGVTTAELRTLKQLFGGRCAYCGDREADTFDHVLPLSRGGLHEIANLLPACKPCNFEKHDKTLEEWAASRAKRRP